MDAGKQPPGRIAPRRRRLRALALLLATALALAGMQPTSGSRSVVDAANWPPVVAIVRADAGAPGVPIPRSFLGLSMEYQTFAHDAGARAGASPDPLLAPLVGGLASGGGPPLLRIGGRSSDASWWDPVHRPAPAGVGFAITPRWLERLSAVVRASGAQALLGLNLAIRDPAAGAAWARAAAGALPAGSIAGFEIGNEPDLYGHVAWYGVPPTRGVPLHGRFARGRRYARDARYGPARFMREFLGYAAAVQGAVAGARFTGPGYSTPRWMPGLPAFLRAAGPALAAVTYHRYPLRACFSPPVAPTIRNLLAPAASRGLAASVAPYVAQARAHGLPFWLTELNSVACGGRRGVSDTFASALWATDTLLALAHAGVARVEIHDHLGSPYDPFALRQRHGRWVAHVAPLYAALRLVAQLAPAGAKVAPLPVHGSARLAAWQVSGPGGRRRVVLIDEDPSARGVVRVVLGTRAPATLVRLDAPALGARSGVRLAGQAFGPDGRLHGRPRVEGVPAAGGIYAVPVRRAGIAVLSVG